MDEYNRHYITVDARGRVLTGFSDAFRQPAVTDVCVNECGGYQFRLLKDGEENPALYNGDGIPLYKYDGGTIMKRSEEEIAEDAASLRALDVAPSQLDMLEAQVTYTAMMTDTLLEV